MKARSNSYADPWTPPRSSASSREALHTAGYEGSLNGCKDSPVCLSHPAWPLPCGKFTGVERAGQGNGVGWWEKGWIPALERLFPSLEGSAFPVPRLRWSIAQLFAVWAAHHRAVKGSLGNLTAQPRWVCSGLFWAHCLCASSLTAHLGPPGTPDLLSDLRAAFLAHAAFTAQHPGHPAPIPSGLQGLLGALGSLAPRAPAHSLLSHGTSALRELVLLGDAQGSSAWRGVLSPP